jgi:hypothetical protein
MAMEMGDRIDIMSYNPAEIATKMIMKDKSQVGGGTISVETAVEVCFRDVGHTDITYGAFAHERTAWIIPMIPKFMMEGMARGTTDEALKEYLDKNKVAYEEAKSKR